MEPTRATSYPSFFPLCRDYYPMVTPEDALEDCGEPQGLPPPEKPKVEETRLPFPPYFIWSNS